MALRDKVVEIAYRLKDRFSKQTSKITSSIRGVGAASATTSASITANNVRAGASYNSLVLGAAKARTAILALGVAFIGGFAAISKVIKATNTQERAEVKLATTLRNLTGATDEQTQALIEQAAGLQQVTGFGDEQIISAQALLGTFKLTADQIAVLTPRLLDMGESARKLGQDQVDLEAISLALGKVFTSGIGSLSRYGVALTEAQKESFKLADQTGKVAILAEILDGNFEGLAAAVGSTFEGAVRKGDAASGDFLETLGKLFTENKAFIQLQTLITKAWEDMADGVEGSADEIGSAITGLVRVVRVSFNSIKIVFNTLQIVVKLAVAPIVLAIGLINKAFASITFGDLSKRFEKNSDILIKQAQGLGDSLVGDLRDVQEGIEGIGNAFTDTADKTKSLTTAADITQDALNKIGETAKQSGKDVEESSDKQSEAFKAAAKAAQAYKDKLETVANTAKEISESIDDSLTAIASGSSKAIADLSVVDVTRGIDLINRSLELSEFSQAQKQIAGVVDVINKLGQSADANPQFLKGQLERLRDLAEIAEKGVNTENLFGSLERGAAFDVASEAIKSYGENIKGAESASSKAAKAVSDSLELITNASTQATEDLSSFDITRGLELINETLGAGNFEQAQTQIKGVTEQIGLLGQAAGADGQFLTSQLERLRELAAVAEQGINTNQITEGVNQVDTQVADLKTRTEATDITVPFVFDTANISAQFSALIIDLKRQAAAANIIISVSVEQGPTFFDDEALSNGSRG